MPAKELHYEPDWIDCNSQITALSEDFGCLVDISLKIERDYVVIYASTYKPATLEEREILCVATAKRPLKARPNAALMLFAVLQDLWLQHDRGVSAVRPEPIAYGWNGRPQVRRRA